MIACLSAHAHMHLFYFRLNQLSKQMVECPQCFTIIGTINIKQINYLNKLPSDSHINLMFPSLTHFLLLPLLQCFFLAFFPETVLKVYI